MTFFNRRVLLFLSIGSALVWGGGSYGYFSRKEKEMRDRSAVVPVVVARKYLRPGQPIDPDRLEEIPVPAAYRQPAAFEKISDFRDASGRPLFTSRIGLLKGEQVTRSKVVEESARWDLAWALEPKRLGLTLSLEPEAAAGGQIRPGDWVAVLAVLDPQPGLPEARADVIEPHVQVSALNGRVAGAMEMGPEKSRGQNLSNESILVTLSLTARQSNRILLARSRGHITLALRSAVDDSPVLSGSVRLSDLRRGLEESP